MQVVRRAAGAAANVDAIAGDMLCDKQESTNVCNIPGVSFIAVRLYFPLLLQ